MKLIYTFACLLLFVFTTYCQDDEVAVLSTSQPSLFIEQNLRTIVDNQVSEVEIPTQGKVRLISSNDTIVDRVLDYDKRGIIYNGKVYPKLTKIELERILFYRPDSLLQKSYVSYIGMKSFSNIVGFIGGAGLGWSLADVVKGKDPNLKLIFSSSAVIAIGLLLQSSANAKLREVINIYNRGISERKVSFSPLIYPSDYNRMNVGVALHF